VRLLPADSLDPDALAELFNEAYSDYVVPLRLDRAMLELTLALTGIDLAGSRVALADDGEPGAFAFLAVRGDEGWIGGMGTAPAYRRKGLGEAALRAVLDEARRLGAASVRLEVIDRNVAARRLYEKLGFEHERDLGVWILDSAPPRITQAQPAALDEAQAWITANRRAPEPWQRGDETVEHMRERGHQLQALAVERGGETAGAAVYRSGPGPPAVLQLAARDEAAAAQLLAAIAAHGDGLRFLNLPTGDPATAALERLGARAELRQHELRLRL